MSERATLASAGRPVIRSAHAGDLARLVDLERACFAEPWREADLLAFLRQPADSVWLLEVAGERPGYAVFLRLETDAELLRFGVEPPLQRRGFGAMLLTGCVAELERAGVGRIFLEVREENVAARGLYEKCGFRLAGRRNRYYPDGADALVYQRSARG